ncbi:hypothetical protein RCL1_002341 [Eukaryota sp. TZLM3-RCL]
MLDYLPLRKRLGDSSWTKNYKYGCVDKSLLSKYVLKPYWDYMIKFIPYNVAPNMVTMWGLLCSSLPSIVILSYVFFEKTVPRFWFLLSAVGIFAYQTLDNLDGRQARRLKASSCLGEITDHCVDSLTSTLYGATTLLAIGVNYQLLVPLLLFPQIAFFMCIIEESYTGFLYLGVVNAPTEGLIMMAFLNIGGFFGLKISSPSQEFFLFMFVFAFSAFTLLFSFVNVFLVTRKQFSLFVRCLYEFFVRIIGFGLIVLLYVCVEHSLVNVFLLLFFSLFFSSIQVLDCLVSVVSKTRMVNSIVLPVVFVTTLASVGVVLFNSFTTLLLSLLLGFMVIRFVSFAVDVVRLFSEDLGIFFLRLTPDQMDYALALKTNGGAVPEK